MCSRRRTRNEACTRLDGAAAGAHRAAVVGDARRPAARARVKGAMRLWHLLSVFEPRHPFGCIGSCSKCLSGSEPGCFAESEFPGTEDGGGGGAFNAVTLGAQRLDA